MTLKPWHQYLDMARRFDFAGVALEGRSSVVTQPATLLFFAMYELEKAGWTDRDVLATPDKIGAERSDFRAAATLRTTEERILGQMPLLPLFSRTP